MQAVLQSGFGDARGTNRALASAIAASFAIHALLLFSFVLVFEPVKRAAPPSQIVARLIPQQAAPSTLRAEEPPQPRQETPPPPPPPPAARPLPAPQTSPAAKAAPAPAAPPAPVAEAPRPAESAPPAPAQPAAPQAAPSAPVAKVDPQPGSAPVNADATDPTTIGQYRIQLAQVARRFRRYPSVAIENNWEGRVDLRLTYNAQGRRVSISVAKTSGHDVLDKQAIDTYAKTFVPVPPSLIGKEFYFEMPVVFSLKEDRQ